MRDMGEDQAAAVLGDACNAYFRLSCECCYGRGELTEVEGMEPHIKVESRECPHCEGSGKAKMPPADEILHAARVIADAQGVPA